MIHAREDYNRIQDPENKIPKNEPVFLLRAQDKFAAITLRLYADKVEQGGGNADIVKATRSHADAMDAWPIKKVPDLK